MGYYTGYIIGMFIDVILSAVFTGGTKTVAEVLNILRTQLTDLFKGIKKAAKSAGNVIDKTTTLLIDDLITIFARIRVGSKNIKPVLDEVLEWLKELLLNGKKVLVELWEKLSVASRKRLESWGLKPTAFENNILSLCPIKP